jgi:hypothetical protein
MMLMHRSILILSPPTMIIKSINLLCPKFSLVTAFHHVMHALTKAFLLQAMFERVSIKECLVEISVYHSGGHEDDRLPGF